MEKERPRTKEKLDREMEEEPEIQEEVPEIQEEENLAVSPAVVRQRGLDYFKKLLKEIQEDLALSNYLEEWVKRVDGSESVGFIINMEDDEETEEAMAPVITGAQKEVVDLGQTSYIALRNLHEWLDDVRYEFMYNPPPEKKKSEYKEWLDEWSKVIFDFAKIEKKHVIYVQELLNSSPFSNLRSGKNAIVDIGNSLTKKKLAIWVVKKEKLRVYWKSLDEWASGIYDWAYKNSKTEPLFIYDLKEEHEPFSDLPENEFPAIFKILEKQNKGKIVKSSDKKLAFVFDFSR
ncbi:MAG TPA: hypothetical protein VKM55_20565 [Candidatus Lokiarchaeia archaeon]|nr:hypothetical protein [Candidatus Lokiarchaeia archaeon]